jgi:uncharacterized protein with HEPN domain
MSIEKKNGRQWEDYIEDIADAIESIEEFIIDMEYEEFLRDKKTNFAVVRSLEIIGEATKNIPDSVRDRYPHVPWKDMAGTRDKMIHHYFGVDLKVVWKTITEDIPSLKPLIRKILNDIYKYRQQETSKDREEKPVEKNT